MHDRIKKLALQANLTEVIDSAYLERNDWQPFVGKFAELIVKECVSISNIERDNSVGCGYVTQTIGQRIRKHFGVEK